MTPHFAYHTADEATPGTSASCIHPASAPGFPHSPSSSRFRVEDSDSGRSNPSVAQTPFRPSIRSSHLTSPSRMLTVVPYAWTCDWDTMSKCKSPFKPTSTRGHSTVKHRNRAGPRTVAATGGWLVEPVFFLSLRLPIFPWRGRKWAKKGKPVKASGSAASFPQIPMGQAAFS